MWTGSSTPRRHRNHRSRKGFENVVGILTSITTAPSNSSFNSTFSLGIPDPISTQTQTCPDPRLQGPSTAICHFLPRNLSPPRIWARQLEKHPRPGPRQKYICCFSHWLRFPLTDVTTPAKRKEAGVVCGPISRVQKTTINEDRRVSRCLQNYNREHSSATVLASV